MLLEQIGEGGFGIVFMAEQTQPLRRKVALKVLKPGMDSGQVLARFEAERQALALMDHPNIARVLDAGSTATGRPYFVMELVRGVPITQFCDDNRLSTRERLGLFTDVCAAVQHAHTKGIIHRDLKPSNVLVTLHDGAALVKVIDFGIAKALGQQLTERTLFTGFAQMVGTPLYMSPEQAGLSDQDVDTRSDVYSLGVLLYELLTGTTPLEKERLSQVGYDEMRRLIREEELPRPSRRLSTLGQAASTISNRRQSDPRQLSKLFRGELDWVVMKALEKDRNRRYESASDFARDVQRYLDDEPVLACPPSVSYRLGKFVRRHRAALAVVGLALFFIALLGGGGGWALRDRAAREKEVALERAARQARLAGDLELAVKQAEQSQEQGNRAEALAALDQANRLASLAPPDPARDKRLAALKGRLAAEARDQAFIARFEKIRLEVQSDVHVKESRFKTADALPEIRKALNDYGIEIGVTAPAQAGALVRSRPEQARRELLAALDECLWREPKGDARTRQWLFAALAAADTDAWRARVRQAGSAGDWKALEKRAREVDVTKQPPSFLLIVADSLPKATKSTRLELFRRIQGAYPSDLWANHKLAWELRRNGQSAEAIRYYTAMLALRPDNPGIYLNRGNAYRDAGEVDAAIGDLQRAVAIAPQYARAHGGLGTALAEKGDLNGAGAAYRRALELDPKHATAHSSLGVVLERQGQRDEAIACYRRAIRHRPDYAGAYLNLGLALAEKGQHDKAVRAFREAVKHQRDYAEAYQGLGRSLQKKGALDGAIAAYRKAVKHQPGLATAHFDLALMLQKKGEWDEAIAEYRQAVQHKPDYVEAHLNLGLALARQGRLDQAAAAFRLAIQHKPGLARAHYALGVALGEKGEPDGAIAAFREAIRLEPGYADAHCNLGLALKRTGRFAEALTAFRDLHALRPKGARNWPYPSERYIKECERLIALNARLPALLRGADAPANARECLEVAYLCMHKQLRGAAVRFFSDAFKASPALAADLRAGDRFGAARAAALAGSGQGRDADQFDDTMRAGWRRQALEWLRADLEAWGRVLDREPGNASLAATVLRDHWLRSADLAGVRGRVALARLPEAERRAWQELWADVADTLARARGETPTKKKPNAK
jgi:serine/threonine-protein kinase